MRRNIHVVPLSGGLDSRIILGGLLKKGLKDSIITITFGTPGTLDYDIGIHIAKQLGIYYEALDLTKVCYDEKSLQCAAMEGGLWTWHRLLGRACGSWPLRDCAFVQ